MAVFYTMQGMNDTIHSAEERKTGLYPRVVNRRTVFLEELIESASEKTTLALQEMRMAYELIIARMLTELRNGNSVCLDNLGMFSLSATSRVVQDKKEIRSNSIFVKRLVFRMSSAFLRKLGVVEFERAAPDGRNPIR
jgi:predicted histone-like DNA-binding protein